MMVEMTFSHSIVTTTRPIGDGPSVGTYGRVTAWLSKRVEFALAEMDLTLPQYRVLGILAEGSAAASGLAGRLAVRPSSVTAIIDGLVAQGLVDRRHEEGDRRRIALRLTDEGARDGGRGRPRRRRLPGLDRRPPPRRGRRDGPPIPRVVGTGTGQFPPGPEVPMSTTEHQLAGAESDDERSEAMAPATAPTEAPEPGVRLQPLAAYVPMGVTSDYKPPKAGVDPDTTKTWIKRAYPIVSLAQGTLPARPHPVLRGPGTAVADPPVPQRRHRQLARRRTPPCPCISTSTGFWSSASSAASRGTSRGRHLFKVAYDIEYDLRNSIYEHLTRMSFPFYDRVQSGQLISRANSDIRSVQMYLTFAPLILVQCSIAVVAFGYMLATSVPLAFVAMATMPLIYWSGIRMRKKLFPVSWTIQSRLADVATVVDENTNGVRVVKSFAAEEQQLRKMATAAEKVQWAYVKDADLRARFSPLIQNLSQVGLVFVLLLGGYLVIHGQLELGAILKFNIYLLMMQAPFMMLGMLIMMGQRAAASAGRIYEILDEKATIVDRPGAVDLVDSAR